ncbi:Transcriptional regulator, AsnC/Lrp family [Bombilactobacillus mellifer]|uniref:Transcriptional regulator, AsnC/Lrp family n=1 Tax=Bombilactobacillus mellifer TaxID=1218492 RepID=A0A0F4LWS8_9LACO|nr:AsnC family transcriptional regulator [Bombilactobacillus mellifer]KJY62813.1 Transcriptional regulator, AsnC/Lrp family [Bombilactobacillus mellifer]
MDQIDRTIIHLLQNNSRLTNKAIGQQVHLTGQAVGQRIKNLEEHQIIQQFSIKVGTLPTQFIRLFLNKVTPSTTITNIVRQFSEVEAFYQVSGQACFLLITHFSDSHLSTFIQKISPWANYTVETVIADKKLSPQQHPERQL